jgi:beta-lactam-binding protein with PASTA domain
MNSRDVATGVLIMLVVALYSLDGESSANFTNPGSQADGGGVITGEEPAGNGGAATALPDLKGLTLAEAVTIVEETGATWLAVPTTDGDFPVGQVIDHSPGPGSTIGPGDVVSFSVSQ